MLCVLVSLALSDVPALDVDRKRFDPPQIYFSHASLHKE